MPRDAKNVRGMLLLLCLPTLTAAGCVRHLAEESLAGALSAQGDAFQSDDDPRLVEAAIPFGLKVMESLLPDLPKHRGLLLSACSGFAGYGYAFVQEEAEEAPADTAGQARAKAGRERAAKLFRRARGYCLRGLDAAHEGLAAALLSGGTRRISEALAKTGKDDVPTLYWTAASWSLLISDSLNDLEIIGQLPAAAALAERALALDPTWNEGTLYDFFVSLDAARGPDQGGGPAKAKAAFDQAMALSHGRRLGLILAYAEGIQLPAQDRKGFEASLKQVLDFDLDQPEARANRLANSIAKRRARFLQSRADDLFL